MAADLLRTRGVEPRAPISNASAGQARLVLGLQAIVVLSAIVSVLLHDVLANSWLLWAMLILVNLALGIVAFGVGHRVLALLGGVATAIAVALLLAHSFSSLPVAGVATALCLGAALFRTGRTASRRKSGANRDSEVTG